MEMSIEVFGEFWHQLLARGVNYWGSWASLLALIGVAYNYARLTKIHKLVEYEHDRILEAMKPLDLFDTVRRLRKLLESDRYTKKKILILKSLDDFSENLRSYFRQIHGLSGITDNMYLEMGQSLLQRNRAEDALEHFRKALAVAREKGDEEEEVECLAGLRECHALEVRVEEFHKIDEELEKRNPSLQLTAWQRIRIAKKITGVWVRVFAELTFTKRRRKGYRRYTWNSLNGSIRKNNGGEGNLDREHLAKTPQVPGHTDDQLR